MDWSIAFLGPAGAGKTAAIQCIADAPVVPDAGTVDLGGGDRLILFRGAGGDCGGPGWDRLLESCRGIVLLIDHRRPDPIDDLDRYLGAIEHRLQRRRVPLVIGMTHGDPAQGRPLRLYEEHLRRRGVVCSEVPPPLFELDVGDATHLRAVLMALAALIEMTERFPRAAAPPPA